MSGFPPCGPQKSKSISLVAQCAPLGFAASSEGLMPSSFCAFPPFVPSSAGVPLCAEPVPASAPSSFDAPCAGAPEPCEAAGAALAESSSESQATAPAPRASAARTAAVVRAARGVMIDMMSLSAAGECVRNI
ncbi:conserved hypothetical protein [Streptomyces sp. SPB78]|nr:conserved hypothetical protein [Streptomyces sp. SPB78]